MLSYAQPRTIGNSWQILLQETRLRNWTLLVYGPNRIEMDWDLSKWFIQRA